MIVRSTKIHRPNAYRLSILVWFKPFIRHRPAQYAPKSSSATHGVSHSAKRGVEPRRTPRVMNSLSSCLGSCLTTSVLGSGAGSVGDFAYPGLPGLIVNLRIGTNRFQQAETIRLPSAPRGFAGR